MQEYDGKQGTRHSDDTNGNHAGHTKQKTHEKSNGVDLSINGEVSDDEFEVY